MGDPKEGVKRLQSLPKGTWFQKHGWAEEEDMATPVGQNVNICFKKKKKIK